MEDVKTFVDGKIAGKRIVLFSKTYCPFCTMANDVLVQYVGSGSAVPDSEYEVIEIDDNPNCDAIQDYLNELTGGRTVPRCFINQKFVGGGSKVKALHEEGKLKSLL